MADIQQVDDTGSEEAVGSPTLGFLYIGGGVIYVGSIGSNTPSSRLDFPLELSWSVNKTVSSKLSFEWSVGEQPNYWFRVVGDCQQTDQCSSSVPISTPQRCAQGSYFVTMVLAKSPQDVCRQLSKSNFVWRITEIGRFSTPANAEIAQAMADAGLIDLNCNTLIPVPFSQFSDCLQFNLSGDEVVAVGGYMKAYDTFLSYEGTGGFSMSGSAESPDPNELEGSGGFHIGGGATYSSTQFNYVGSGGFHVGGGASNTSSQFNVSGSGGIHVNGSVGTTSTQFDAEGEGGFQLGGSAESVVRLSFASSGYGIFGPTFAGVQLKGSADVAAQYYFSYEGTGGFHVGGSGVGASSQFNAEGSGGFHIGGDVLTTSPDYNPEGSGGFELGGGAESSFGISASGGGGAHLSGSALASLKLPAAGSGGFHVGGNALINKFFGAGGFHVGGSAIVDSTWKGEYIDEVGWDDVCLNLSPNFGAGTSADYVPTVSTVNVCGARGIPTSLQVVQNFSGSKLLENFLTRNGLVFPNILKISYRRASGTWHNTYQYRGVANGASQERWNFFVEFGCVSDAYGLSVSPVWKFDFKVTRTNEQSGLSFDTRILSYFNAEPLSTYFNKNGVDLNLGLNPNTKALNIVSSNAVLQDVTLFDGIGLFSPAAWGTKDFQYRVQLVGTFSQSPNYDIFPIFPRPEEYAVTV